MPDMSPPADGIDPNIKMPDAVRAASARIEQMYTPPAADPPAPAPEPVVAAVPEPPPAPAPAPAPLPPAADPVPSADEIKSDGWANKYNAMRGRFDHAQQRLAQLETGYADAQDEIARLQALVGAPRSGAPAPTPAPAKTFLTDKDREDFGDPLIDFAKRAALESVAPVLNELQARNAQLERTQAVTNKRAMVERLTELVPNWREINNDARWKQWLRLPDVYSGRVRQELLNDASSAANAPRVASFFKGFLDEERATGNAPPAPQTEPPVAPRVAALPIEVISTPGRARPASSITPTAADKPTYKRTDIAAFYRAKNAGQLKHMTPEQILATEQDIFAAQREGRIK